MVVSPNETNPPLIVDADRMLPLPLAAQRLQPIAGWHAEIVKALCVVDDTQFAQR
jgi:hypothetical protein